MAEMPSTTTLLMRRLPADGRIPVRLLLALAGEASPKQTDADDDVYVLVDIGGASDDEPLAAALVTCPSALGDVVLVALAVVPRWHGRGLGGRLLGEVVDELRADGVSRVWVPMPFSDAGSGDQVVCHRLFRRRGFLPSDAPPGWPSGTLSDWGVLEL